MIKFHPSVVEVRGLNILHISSCISEVLIMHSTYSLLLLMLTCLAYSTNCVVYHVVPDDHYLATNNNTLQHYLNNSEKYFTSHTQLVFLPGKHHLHTDLVVQHVVNLTIEGKEMYNTAVYCTTPAHINISNSDGINIRYLDIYKCGCYQIDSPFSSLYIFNCSDISIDDSLVLCDKQCGLVLVNVVGDTHLFNIASSHLLITHNMTRGNSTMRIVNYNHIRHSSDKYRAVEIRLYEHSQHIKIDIYHAVLNLDKAINIYCSTSKGVNKVTIARMNVTGIILAEDYVRITIINGIRAPNDDLNIANVVTFYECKFFNINSGNHTTGPGLFVITHHYIHLLFQQTSFYLLNCTINDIDLTVILRTNIKMFTVLHENNPLLVVIENTSFSMIKSTDSVLWLEATTLWMNGTVIFKGIITNHAIIYAVRSSIELFGDITFLLNKAKYCFVTDVIYVVKYTKLNITANRCSVLFFNNHVTNGIVCLFQYYKDQPGIMGTNYEPSFQNYSIVLQDNIGDTVSNRRYTTSHCDWIIHPSIIFAQLDPFVVNQHIVRYVNNTMSLRSTVPNTVCYCTDDQHFNCSIDELGPVYPGQTLVIRLTLNGSASLSGAQTRIADNFVRACNSHSIKSIFLLSPNTCTEIRYNILNKNGGSCNVYFKGQSASIQMDKTFDITLGRKFIDAYRIKISLCPLGFALNKMLQLCQCDPVLKISKISADSCNIDTLTIPRPANSWITGKTNVDNSHTYQVSTRCPFDYCLPHSSHLNLSNPDSQCQFNRTGVLCGRCKEGLSTVLGTSQCRQCSNFYLFLLLFFILAGMAFIVFLFTSNFTVADGSINGLIFYANIVSINGPVFFPSYEPTKYVYVLTSFLNLDLGIEVCFYNGMDNYTKMWLQLIFPIYLIFIATLLIITSRYSTRIQRLTAHRALPVLATLFLLSYTKILRTVSSVLFSYSTITSLPSKNTTLVWSVDTEVQLFGLKFIVLFIVCLVLFLILLPFNTVLIFTRTLSQFKCINRFKPLLDAYQGPYKDRFYYWTGLQLLLRAVFYGISALDRNTNMMIGILILGVVECVHGMFGPYKSKVNNRSELLLIFNLHALFVASWYTTTNSIAVNTLVIVAIVYFFMFTCYHIKLYRKVIDIPIFVTLSTKLKLEKCFRYMQSQQLINQTNIELCTPAPEVAYNYKEFREPLIGQDK